jgi:hypothetical protein
VATPACALHAKPTHAHAHRHEYYGRVPLRCRDVKRFLSATDRFGHVTWGPRWARRAVPCHGPCRASEGRPRRATELHAPGRRAGRPTHCPLALAAGTGKGKAALQGGASHTPWLRRACLWRQRACVCRAGLPRATAAAHSVSLSARVFATATALVLCAATSAVRSWADCALLAAAASSSPFTVSARSASAGAGTAAGVRLVLRRGTLVLRCAGGADRRGCRHTLAMRAMRGDATRQTRGVQR